MHCPLCGGKLTEVERKDPEQEAIDILVEQEVDFGDPRWDNIPDPSDDHSVWFKCTHCKSFGDDYPLQMHHPLRGIYSKSGDSWSLSWVK